MSKKILIASMISKTNLDGLDVDTDTDEDSRENSTDSDYEGEEEDTKTSDKALGQLVQGNQSVRSESTMMQDDFSAEVSTTNKENIDPNQSNSTASNGYKDYLQPSFPKSYEEVESRFGSHLGSGFQERRGEERDRFHDEKRDKRYTGKSSRAGPYDRQSSYNRRDQGPDRLHVDSRDTDGRSRYDSNKKKAQSRRESNTNLKRDEREPRHEEEKHRSHAIVQRDSREGPSKTVINREIEMSLLLTLDEVDVLLRNNGAVHKSIISMSNCQIQVFAASASSKYLRQVKIRGTALRHVQYVQDELIKKVLRQPV